MNQTTLNAENETAVTAVRAPYQAPQLTALGDVRDLTLGGSPGTGDSGSAGTQQF
jgi:hypothetical protein